MRYIRSFLLKFCLICAILGQYSLTWAQQSINIDSGEASISADVYSSKGQRLLVWLPPEGGFQPIHALTAKKLSSQGIEVWLVDLFEARFLPPIASSLDQIPATDVESLINTAHQTGKKVILVSSGRGILPLLRGAHLWQSSPAADQVIAGTILISPQFYVETPDPGQPAELLPVVAHTNLPIFIMQPRLSPWVWKLEQTIPALQQSGSDVYLWILPEVRDRFHYRPDASPAEQRLGENLADLLNQASSLLSRVPSKPRTVNPYQELPLASNEGKKERQLKPYQGNPQPQLLAIPDLKGKRRNLQDYRGKVVLVNFWASWCPPCVHEMPSMQRLADKLGTDDFTILAVNMAESSETIQTFLQTKVNIDFPVLLDQDGEALQRWGVFAFPTSYVIDKHGKIRYALFGSVDWDTQEMLQTFTRLINEP